MSLKGRNFQMMFLSLCKGLHRKVEMVLSDLKIYKKSISTHTNTLETVPSGYHMALQQML